MPALPCEEAAPRGRIALPFKAWNTMSQGLGMRVPATIKKRPLIGVVTRGIILPRKRQPKLLARHHSLTIVPWPARMLAEPVMIMNPPSSDSEVPTRPEILADAGMN